MTSSSAALLACSILALALLQWGDGRAAPEEDGPPLRLARAKRGLIGTPSLPLMVDHPRRKRPFCNAFTGCGRKRSEAPGAMDDDAAGSMGTLVELNSEPAVAELSRQILSEAKLWEAIQEARQEIDRRRQAALAFAAPSDGQPRDRRRRDAIAKGTLPSAGDGALPIV